MWLAAVLVAIAAGTMRAGAQASSSSDDSAQMNDQGSTGYTSSGQAAAPAISPNSVLLDSVVGVVNGDVILQSDVTEEVNFSRLEPFRSPGQGTVREQALGHLINRTLILQQMHEQQSQIRVTDAEVKEQIDQLRKHLPECAGGRCESEAGWSAVLAAHGFTPDVFAQRWGKRMLVLKYIEQRFRSGVRISKPEIQTYYANQFVPQFKQKNLPPPSLTAVSQRIDEILLQQHVNGLLQDWLATLKDQGSVAILDPQYRQPGLTGEQRDAAASGDDSE